MRQLLEMGLDPSEERQAEKREQVARATGHIANRFEHIAREWLEIRSVTWSPRYAALVVGRLEADIFPAIGKLDIAEIRAVFDQSGS